MISHVGPLEMLDITQCLPIEWDKIPQDKIQAVFDKLDATQEEQARECTETRNNLLQQQQQHEPCDTNKH
jgi:hypothetical protein